MEDWSWSQIFSGDVTIFWLRRSTVGYWHQHFRLRVLINKCMVSKDKTTLSISNSNKALCTSSKVHFHHTFLLEIAGLFGFLYRLPYSWSSVENCHSVLYVRIPTGITRLAQIFRFRKYFLCVRDLDEWSI